VAGTIVLGLLCAICWGLPDVNLARAARAVGPLAVVVGSLLLGTLAVTPVLLFVDGPDWSVRGVAIAAAAAAAIVPGYLLGYTAFQRGDVSVVAPVIACEGGVAAAIALAAGEDVSRGILLLLPFAVAGVVLAAMADSSGSGRGGVALASGAALLWGLVLVLSAPVADELGVVWGFVTIRVLALLFVLPIALRAGAATRWTRDRWNVLAWALGDAFAYLLYVAAADRGPVSVAGVLAAQFATVAVLAGVVMLDERPRRRQWAGIVLVIAAVSAIAAVGG
jgi:drug/metabolite transporter (DMT)-like permease